MFKDTLSSSCKYKSFKALEKVLLIIFTFVLLISLTLTDISFFHMTIEIIGVIIGASIFIIAIFTYNITKDNSFSFIGITFGFIAFFELLQTLYPADSNYSLQFSLCTRVFQCLFLLSLNNKIIMKFRLRSLFYVYFSLSLILICSILLWNVFPKCSIIDGLFNPFYLASCCFMIIWFIIGLTVFYQKSQYGNQEIKNLLCIYCLLTIFHQVTIFLNVGSTNQHLIVIHLIKALCNIPMFILITQWALKEPIKLMFKDLNIKNEELAKKEALLAHQNKELIMKNKALVRANAIIMSAHDKYQRLLQFFPGGILILKGNIIIFTNNTFNEILEYPITEKLINRDILTLLPEKCWDSFSKELNSVYAGNNIQKKRAKFFLNSGVKLDLEYSILYSLLDDEKHALVLIEDITEKIKAEELINSLKIDEENEKLKIGFLANISHELRTPINLIYSALQLENLNLSNSKLDSIEKYNKVIKQNCFRLLRIINNLIDATKIDASFFKPNMRYLNIVSVIEEATLSVVPFVESKSMTLIFDTDIEEKYTLCDPDLVERIVLNLLANSVKYGVYEGHITVTIRDFTDYINVYFKDNGIGIPQNKKQLLFSRFMQVDKSFSRNAEGSGIGLYLVRQFVEMHNGTISLESEENEGSEFCITLPCKAIEENLYQEIKLAGIDLAENSTIIDKVNIEFSDIYMK